MLSKMSQYFTRNTSSAIASENIVISPSDGIVGLILSCCYVPDEILTRILSYVDPDSLLQCRKVCKYWRSVIDQDVWKLKLRREQCQSLSDAILITTLQTHWVDCYWFCKKNPIGKNLLKNHSGQEEFKHWKILSNGGNKWKVENPPIGADLLPATEEFCGNFCYATSYHSCSKEQIIDLKSEGFTHNIMDTVQPCITVSEWFAGRFDCGCVYEMKVILLNEKKEEVADYEHRETIQQWEGKKWSKVEHMFVNYGPGVRYVAFYHGGMDTQMWAGHYGSKMAAACVKVSLRQSDE